MKMTSKLKLVLTCMAVLALTCSIGSMAQTTFPDKPVRLILAYSTGTGPDTVARLIAERLSEKWKQQVIVDNRAGASGFIAIQGLKSAPADGYNLLVVDNGHVAVNPHIHKTIPFDSAKDFAGVTTVFKNPFFIATSSSGPVDSVPKLIAMAKAKPGELSYGSPFVGSPSHLGGALFEQMTDTKMIHAPFKEMGQMLASVAGQDVSWFLGSVSSTKPFVDSGRMNLLAVASSKRLAGFEKIPTVEEAGGPKGYVVEAWVGFIARKGTPDAVIAKINRDVVEILQSAPMKKRLTEMGIETWPSTPTELDGLIARETISYGELVKKAKIEPQ
jgi:tripartite-type tricarboxylate transporter receptor subunit TctC